MLGSEVGLQAILFHSPYAFIEITNVISERIIYVSGAVLDVVDGYAVRGVVRSCQPASGLPRHSLSTLFLDIITPKGIPQGMPIFLFIV